MNKKPLASLSLDLDNLWTYLKVKGDSRWEEYPTYLPVFLPYCLDLLDELNLRITFFIVGKDASLPQHKDLMREIARRGHEVANHTYNHEPWMHIYSHEELKAEIILAENAIEDATGLRPRGFRGPGFTWSRDLFEILSERGYLYDSSTLPTYIGPVARLYYFWISGLKEEAKKKREYLFGSFRNGFLRLEPYLWDLKGFKPLLEIPVTTIPLVKTPFHMSYLMYLAGFSPFLAMKYFALALQSCKTGGIAPNFLLHPPDFMDLSQAPDMSFFPGMKLSRENKKELFKEVINKITGYFEIATMTGRAQSELEKSLKRETPS